jgi:hypothetical protein
MGARRTFERLSPNIAVTLRSLTPSSHRRSQVPQRIHKYILGTSTRSESAVVLFKVFDGMEITQLEFWIRRSGQLFALFTCLGEDGGDESVASP